MQTISELKAVDSFLRYMCNAWDEQECNKVFKGVMATHFWSKWVGYCRIYDSMAAVVAFYFSLTDEYAEALIKRSIKYYNK